MVSTRGSQLPQGGKGQVVAPRGSQAALDAKGKCTLPNVALPTTQRLDVNEVKPAEYLTDNENWPRYSFKQNNPLPQ